MAVCHQLSDLGGLTYEKVIDVITGLTICSVPDFVKLFDFLLQQAKVKAVDIDTHEGNILKQIEEILSKAVDHSLCTAGTLYVSNKSSGLSNVVCWFCEKEGYYVNKCPQPKDQKKIATNKFSEQKQSSREANGGSKPSNSDNGSQNKWGAPKNGSDIIAFLK